MAPFSGTESEGTSEPEKSNGTISNNVCSEKEIPMQRHSLLPENLIFGQLVLFQGLGMIPLQVANDPQLPAIDLLDEALERRSVSVGEISDNGKEIGNGIER